MIEIVSILEILLNTIADTQSNILTVATIF